MHRSHVVLAAAFIPCSIVHATTPSIESLGVLVAGQDSFAESVSADGSVVVGYARTANGDRAFRWDAINGMVALPMVTYGTRAYARGVSEGGGAVAGFGYVLEPGERAWRWTQPSGTVGLGDLAGGPNSSGAADMSADGFTVVGTGRSTNGVEAWRWTQAGGMQALGDLPGGAFESRANGVSHDGTVVVGQSVIGEDVFGNDTTAAFYWTEAGGMVSIGDLDGGGVQAEANATNTNGTVIVGESYSYLAQTEAFRWSAGTGMQPLGFVPGGGYSSARAVSGDGRTVVGYSDGKAFIWTQADGMRLLRDVLEDDLGVDTTGWSSLTIATDISQDGTVIVGYGIFQGDLHAFRAVIPGLDCPGDVNGDGATNASDFAVMAGNYGDGPGMLPEDGDLTGDGFVNAADFTVLASGFGCGTG